MEYSKRRKSGRPTNNSQKQLGVDRYQQGPSDYGSNFDKRLSHDHFSKVKEGILPTRNQKKQFVATEMNSAKKEASKSTNILTFFLNHRTDRDVKLKNKLIMQRYLADSRKQTERAATSTGLRNEKLSKALHNLLARK